MRVELHLPDDLADALNGAAEKDRRTLEEFLVHVLGDFAFGHARHYPATTEDELAAFRAKRSGARRIPLTAKERNTVFERDNGRCHYCDGTILFSETFHIDHIKPISKGGTNDRANLCLSCVRCNLKKAAK